MEADPAAVVAELGEHVCSRVAFEVDEYDDTYAASVVLKGAAHRLQLRRLDLI